MADIYTTEDGQEIDRAQVAEVKKAPGENNVFFCFLKPDSEGRKRFVISKKDADELSGRSQKGGE